MKAKQNCIECFTIICKQCGWRATSQDVLKIQKGILTSCPVCNWKPGQNAVIIKSPQD